MSRQTPFKIYGTLSSVGSRIRRMYARLQTQRDINCGLTMYSLQGADGFLRHKDMFDQYIMPRMSENPRSDWDNESDGEETEVHSLEHCQASCQQDLNCRQYSFEEKSGICKTRKDPRLGIAKEGFRSGWVLDRMAEFREGMAPCHDEGWLT